MKIHYSFAAANENRTPRRIPFEEWQTACQANASAMPQEPRLAGMASARVRRVDRRIRVCDNRIEKAIKRGDYSAEAKWRSEMGAAAKLI